jgi:HTH-type transcriptional regulator / antitoxin HigA
VRLLIHNFRLIDKDDKHECTGEKMKLKGIQTEEEYQAALKEIERLWDALPGTPEAEQVEKLTLLVVSYEKECYPIEAPNE